MNSVTGTITYMGFNGPWTIDTGTDAGAVDAKALILAALRTLIGRQGTIRQTDRWSMVVDTGSDIATNFAQNLQIMHLDMPDFEGAVWPSFQVRGGFGFQNVSYYISHFLSGFNKTRISIRWDETTLTIAFDQTQDVPRTQFCDKGNLALADSKGRCNDGGPCAFLVGTDRGFRCAKNDQIAEGILDRILRGTMKATRIGPCVVDGRVE